MATRKGGLQPIVEPQPGSTIKGGDNLTHFAACGHADINPLMSHRTGIAAHVAIYLKPCVSVWEAYRAIIALPAIPGLHVEKVHVSLGEIDMLADIHAMWTDDFDDPKHPPRQRGRETRLIGEWVDKVRTLAPKGTQVGRCECCYVARTSTNVCMMPDS